MNYSAPKYHPVRVGGALHALVETRADGVRVLRVSEALQPYPRSLNERLAHWANVAPQRILAAQRDSRGAWRSITYADMLEGARAVGQALLERGLSAERPVAILSGNDLEHLTLALGAMWAGVPYAPISPAYSLVSRDYAKLKHALQLLTPGLVFGADGATFAKAIAAAVPGDIEVVLAQGGLADRASTPFDALLRAQPGASLDAAHARIDPDTVVKFLFTSGSTKLPKAVTHTQRMLCSNQQMILQCFAFLADEPPVLVDWLPWHHTFGGNHNLGIVLHNGGTLYIDEGKPAPQAIAPTLTNLREISPTVYFNVPRGFEEIVAAMEHDAELRTSMFRRLRAFFFAAAGLAQPIWDRLDRLAEQETGKRIVMMTGLGMTETSPASVFALHPGIRSGHIGLPLPGCETKLVPAGDKLEIRFRGPHVMPGYWRAPDLTREAFDEEGYYRTGDAVKFVDPADPQRGLLFDGRLVEDFKLSTGTFVSVGPLRAQVIAAGAPYVQDVVITAPDRNDVGMLLFPRLEDCRRLVGLDANTSAEQVLRAPALRAYLDGLLRKLAADATGTANRIVRAMWLTQAPSIDSGEVTDKGSINQRAVLTHRARLVDALYQANDAAVVQLTATRT